MAGLLIVAAIVAVILLKRDSGGEPVAVRYSVSYAGSADTGPADVTYVTPGGEVRRERVSLPWSSDVYRFSAGADVKLTAVAPESVDGSLQCEVNTDQGPYGRTRASSGPSSCRVDHDLSDYRR